MRHSSGQVAVIGGGWSGLACAERLASSLGGDRVVLFEAAPQLGGRARGLLWEDGVPIDAGQHLLIAAYRETLALLQRSGALRPRHWRMDWLQWSSHCGEQSESLTGLLPDLLACWPQLQRRPVRDLAVDQWLLQSRCSSRLMAHLLRPLAESALNTDWTEASALCFQTVLRDACRRGPLSLRTLHPRSNLSIDGVDPIAHRLSALGVKIELRSRVTRLIPAALGRWAIEGPAGRFDKTFDEVVMALPDSSLRRLLQGVPHGPEPDARAIGTLFLLFPPGHRHRPPGRIQCFQGADRRQGSVMGLARPPGPWGQVLAMVVSALPQQRDAQDEARLRAQAAAEQWLGGAQPTRLQWLVDRQATWPASPEALARQATLGEARALGGGLWHCSDQMAPGYPATIESAVRAGRAAALALLS